MIIELPKENIVEINISSSFWERCTELRSAKIGRWMLEHGFAPWAKGKPQKLRLELIGDRKFKLDRI